MEVAVNEGRRLRRAEVDSGLNHLRAPPAARATAQAGPVRPAARVPKSVVRRIQRQRSRGETLREIAESLNWDEVPTAQGVPSPTTCLHREGPAGGRTSA